MLLPVEGFLNKYVEKNLSTGKRHVQGIQEVGYRKLIKGNNPDSSRGAVSAYL